MLHNWVKDGIGFNSQSGTPDMNLTRNALYNGGTTALLHSRGILVLVLSARANFFPAGRPRGCSLMVILPMEVPLS